jgi:uncharacterized membrane protein YfcA
VDPLWWLIPAGIVAGFIDSMVGGGGVITLPALLAAGLPPHAAVATNKVAGAGASGMATWQYVRAGLSGKFAWGLFPVALTGGAIGANILLHIPEDWVLGIVAVAVVLMVAYVALQPAFGQAERTSILDARTVWLVGGLVLLIATYDGLLGPGTGTLLLFTLVSLCGLGFLRGAAYGRILNFGSNIGALAWLATRDLVDWRLGLGVMLGTITGAFIGSRVHLQSGGTWVRPLFVLMSLGLLGRLVWAWL